MDKLKALLGQGYTLKHCCRVLGLKYGRAYYYCQKHGIDVSPKRCRVLTPMEIEKVRDWTALGYSQSKIGELLGVSCCTVQLFQKRYEIPLVHPRGVVKEWDVAEGIRMHQKGLKQTEIAAHFGVAQEVVSRAFVKQNYRSLPRRQLTREAGRTAGVDLQEMVGLVEAGWDQTSIGRFYGLSQGCVSRYLCAHGHRKQGKHQLPNKAPKDWVEEHK